MTSAPAARLILVGLPIGNPGDASLRVREVLAGASVIAAEDTRRLRTLLQVLGVQLAPQAKLISYFEGNEASRTPLLVQHLLQGHDVVLVTDAGMPSVSDPGYRLVAAALEHDIVVTVVPGPSAVLAALAVSALPVDRFCFEGFLPRKQAQRATRLAELAGEPRTLVFFEAPHRIGATLTALEQAFGPHRQAALCRELTKTYEQVLRAGLADLADQVAENPPRGEITLVVAGADPLTHTTPADPPSLAAQVGDLQAQGIERKQAIATAAAQAGVSKRQVFDALVQAKQATPLNPNDAAAVPDLPRRAGDSSRQLG